MALRHLDGVAAQMVQFVPAVDVECVMLFFVVFAEDEDVRGVFDLAGAQVVVEVAAAVVEDQRELALLGGELLQDAVAQNRGEEGGEDDDVFVSQVFVVGNGFEQADGCLAAAENEDVVVEPIAGESLEVAVAAAGEDVGYCGNEKRGDEQEAGECNDDLQQVGHGRGEGQGAGAEQEPGGFDQTGMSAVVGGYGGGGPAEAYQSEQNDECKAKAEGPQEWLPGTAGVVGAVEMPEGS